MRKGENRKEGRRIREEREEEGDKRSKESEVRHTVLTLL